jgi:Fur family ferric uptake transcriptional regulator
MNFSYKLQIIRNLYEKYSTIANMNEEIKEFKRLLKIHRYYVTKARLRLFAILQNHPALTIKELIKLSAKNDQATVYRNIIVFEKLCIVSRLQLGWHSKLELSDMFRYHHHHLTCTTCGDVVALPDNQILEREISQLAKSHDFKPSDHQLEIRGTCKNCIRAATTS